MVGHEAVVAAFYLLFYEEDDLPLAEEADHQKILDLDDDHLQSHFLEVVVDDGLLETHLHFDDCRFD
jgi:hypothetical protein